MNSVPPFLAALLKDVERKIVEGFSAEVTPDSTMVPNKDGNHVVLPRPIFMALMVMYRSYLGAMNEMVGENRESVIDEFSGVSSESMMVLCHMMDTWLWLTFKKYADQCGVALPKVDDEPAN